MERSIFGAYLEQSIQESHFREAQGESQAMLGTPEVFVWAKGLQLGVSKRASTAFGRQVARTPSDGF